MIKIITRREPTDSPPLAGWFKSSFSASNSSCVEIKFDDEAVLIRDTKDRGDGPTITLAVGHWMAFLDELTNQAAAGTDGAVSVETTAAGTTLLRATGGGTTLRFTKNEWEMFLSGVRAHEFDHPGLAMRAS